VAACTAAILGGARIVRVHESRDVRQAADLCEAMLATTG
jgi:dihydropteroate synthase